MNLETFLAEAQKLLPKEKIFVQMSAGEPYGWRASVHVKSKTSTWAFDCIAGGDTVENTLKDTAVWISNAPTARKRRLTQLRSKLAQLEAETQPEGVPA